MVKFAWGVKAKHCWVLSTNFWKVKSHVHVSKRNYFFAAKVHTHTPAFFTSRLRLKVHIFWEGHKILRNLPLTFDRMYCSQKLGEDFAKFLWPSQNIWTLSTLFCLSYDETLEKQPLSKSLHLFKSFDELYVCEYRDVQYSYLIW